MYLLAHLTTEVSYTSYTTHNATCIYLSHCRYPPHHVPDVVVSEVELWEVRSNWRSKLRRRPDYNVIFKQRDLDMKGEVKASVTFVLHETLDLDSSRHAFEEICCTLEPMVDDGSLMMTKKFLKEIITPEPREPSRLVFELMEIMERNVCSLT